MNGAFLFDYNIKSGQNPQDILNYCFFYSQEFKKSFLTSPLKSFRMNKVVSLRRGDAFRRPFFGFFAILSYISYVIINYLKIPKVIVHLFLVGGCIIYLLLSFF